MADTFLGAIRDYLPSELHTRAADDLALIRAFVAPDAGARSKAREGLVRSLAGNVSKKDTAWKSAARQVQRWVTQAGQKRGKTGFAKGARGDVTRAKVQRALAARAARYTPVKVHFEGWIKFSQIWSKTKEFTAPVGRKPISLEELQDILKLARLVEKEEGAGAAEEKARQVLVGFWMGDPSDDAALKADYGVLLPFREDVAAWGDGVGGDDTADDTSVEFTVLYEPERND